MSGSNRFYSMTVPCVGCPFGRGPDAVRGLTEARLSEIVTGGGFVCHKTSRETGTGNERECAGFMIYRLAHNHPTQMMRIAARVAMMSEETIAALESAVGTGLVIEDFDELVEAHKRRTP